MKELTILMPCLNEARTIETCVARARRLLDDLDVDGEVLVADNGSVDGSAELAEKAGARVVRCPVKGYGAVTLYGIHQAEGQYILMGDSDDSYHFDEAHPFIQQLQAGADLCIGSRRRGKIMPGAMPFLNQYFGNPVLTFFGRILFGVRSTDFRCGMRAFNSARIKDLELISPGMEWAAELVIRAKLEGLSITEVPVTLYKDGRNAPPHLRRWRDGLKHLSFMFKIAIGLPLNKRPITGERHAR